MLAVLVRAPAWRACTLEVLCQPERPFGLRTVTNHPVLRTNGAGEPCGVSSRQLRRPCGLRRRLRCGIGMAWT
eukprot:179046-Chlamydomonas_euryale.AAC.1